MNETIIKNSAKKQIKIFILFISLGFICLSAAYYIAFVQKTMGFTFSILFLAIGVLSVIFAICMAVFSFANKKNIGLVLNRDGIKFNNTQIARQLGFIKWSEISKIKEEKNYGQQNLTFPLKNYEKHFPKFGSNAEKIKEIIQQKGLILNASELEIGYDEMRHLVLQYFNKYN